MDRALVLVQDSDASRQLARRAGRIASAVGAELVVARILDEAQYQSTLERSAGSGKTIDSIGEAAERADEIAEAFAADAFADHDVSYRTLGAVERLPEGIVDVAEAEACDHVFVVGRRRSPTGKAVFGDHAQHVILNFDGMVTVLATEEEP